MKKYFPEWDKLSDEQLKIYFWISITMLLVGFALVSTWVPHGPSRFAYRIVGMIVAGIGGRLLRPSYNHLRLTKSVK